MRRAHFITLFAVILLAGSVPGADLLAQEGPRFSLYEAWEASWAPVRSRRIDRPAAYLPPRFELGFAVALGTMDHQTQGSVLDGSDEAALFRLQFEGFGPTGAGGGIRFESILADDGILGPSTEASVGELFIFGTYRFEQDRIRVPLRVGFLVNALEVENGPVDVDYGTLGFRLEVEPEVEVYSDGRVRCSLYGGLGLGFGRTEFETSPGSLDDDASSVLTSLEIGARVELGHARLGIGYTMRRLDIDDGDVFFGVDNEFEGVRISLAVEW